MRFVLGTEKTDPKSEVQFRDYARWFNGLALKAQSLLRVVDLLLLNMA